MVVQDLLLLLLLVVMQLLRTGVLAEQQQLLLLHLQTGPAQVCQSLQVLQPTGCEPVTKDLLLVVLMKMLLLVLLLLVPVSLLLAAAVLLLRCTGLCAAAALGTDAVHLKRLAVAAAGALSLSLPVADLQLVRH